MARWKGLEDPQGRAWACGVSREHWGSAGTVTWWVTHSEESRPTSHAWISTLPVGIALSPKQDLIMTWGPCGTNAPDSGEIPSYIIQIPNTCQLFKPRRLGCVSGMLPSSPVAVTSLWKEICSLDDWPFDHLQNNLFFSLLIHFQKKQSYWWEVLY